MEYAGYTAKRGELRILEMGVVYPGVPRKLVLWLRDEAATRDFVETGTNRAGTARWAARHFDRVVSIEADPADGTGMDDPRSPRVPATSLLWHGASTIGGAGISPAMTAHV
jgi:hypothetical protein